MSQREFTINGRLEVVENKIEHGTWTVHDIKTGKTLSRCVRTVAELAHLFQPGPPRNSTTVDES